MTYDDIIAEIKSNLTGNADKDKAYLIKQFKMHNLKEIHLELGRLLWDLMSDEEQKEYKKGEATICILSIPLGKALFVVDCLS